MAHRVLRKLKFELDYLQGERTKTERILFLFHWQLIDKVPLLDDSVRGKKNIVEIQSYSEVQKVQVLHL